MELTALKMTTIVLKSPKTINQCCIKVAFSISVQLHSIFWVVGLGDGAG